MPRAKSIIVKIIRSYVSKKGSKPVILIYQRKDGTLGKIALLFNHPNFKAAYIAMHYLSTICESAGVDKFIRDTKQLHGKKIRITERLLTADGWRKPRLCFWQPVARRPYKKRKVS